MEPAQRLELIRLILQVLSLQLDYLAEEDAGAHGSAHKECPAPAQREARVIAAARPARQQLVTMPQIVQSNLMGKAIHSAPQPSTAPLADELRPHCALLTELARRYIWWLPPEEAMDYPARVAAQVMNIGVFQDTARLAESVGDDCLRAVVRQAEAGQFNARSWHYWHYRLGLAEPGHVPPLPVRHIP
jgi:hypothetical protein